MPLPTIPSTELQAGFLLLVLLMGIWWTYAVGRAYAPANGANWNISRAGIGLSVFVLWVAFLFGVSQQIWAHNFDSFPPPGLRVFLLLILLTIVIAYSPIGRKLAAGLPLVWLVGFQVFRLPTELLIHQAANAGLAPMEMTFEGRNFDIVTALLALVLAVLLSKGEVSAKLIMVWNLLGLALLLNVVITAVMAMPHPLQMLNTTPPNVWVPYFPFILLPGVLVCSALLGHLLVFRALALQPRAKRAE
jgi:hypothetical protein